MFPAALIVFRETLEAALFIGIVAAATRGLRGRTPWLTGGVAAGVLGALALAAMAERVSAWADGIGQDLLNVGILSVALAMLVWHCLWVSTHGGDMAAGARRLGTSAQQGQRPPWALMVAVALAVLREGAETVLFVSGSVVGSEASSGAGVLLGSGMGLLAGVVTGVLMYAGLSRIPTQRLFAVTNVLMAFLAAAIASQLARALVQAGLVEWWSTPLWDSSNFIQSDSFMGTALHALLGYDARPSGLQLGCYLGMLLLIGAGTRWIAHSARRPLLATQLT